MSEKFHESTSSTSSVPTSPGSNPLHHFMQAGNCYSNQLMSITNTSTNSVSGTRSSGLTSPKFSDPGSLVHMPTFFTANEVARTSSPPRINSVSPKTSVLGVCRGKMEGLGDTVSPKISLLTTRASSLSLSSPIASQSTSRRSSINSVKKGVTRSPHVASHGVGHISIQSPTSPGLSSMNSSLFNENHTALGSLSSMSVPFFSSKPSVLEDSNINCFSIPKPTSSSFVTSIFENVSLVDGRFSLFKNIGKGAFGEVFTGIDNDSEQEIAVKIEPRAKSHLAIEYDICNTLSAVIGFPSVFFYGLVTTVDCEILVMQKLGPSLDDLLMKCNRKFSMKTTLLLANQILYRVEAFHSSTGHVHRDIKPSNFLVSENASNLVYLIDFGLAKRFCDSDGVHIPFTEYPNRRGLTGTSRYASMNAHYNRAISRRDDLESIGYMLVHFATGKLPWARLKPLPGPEEEKQRLRKVREMKKMSIDDSSLFANLPDEFKQYMHYVCCLDFKQVPDYNYLRTLFKDLYSKLKFDQEPEIYDWNTILPNI